MNPSSKKPVLSEETVDKNPFRQFEEWYGESYRLLGEEASAMSLCTSADNQPNARIVYLRGSDKKGYWFFTNYNGKKAKELNKNNKACLLLFWARMDRQVRMQGTVERLSAKESDNYFASRARESQIGAWASPQSTTIPNRAMLEEWVKEFGKMFEGKKIPRPANWGGYRFVPKYFEFWYGRESRLHDRIIFTKQKSGKWKIERLSP
ncbi:MAG: pyridoxamine 5'-phosphate oxidase [Bacteroidetes bacterium]|nr:pyridoxamine 5'-phosphate oxidase [Bacteroidota bacterium]